MKKAFAALTTLGTYLSIQGVALAQIDVGVRVPTAGINPATTIGTILSNALLIIFVAAALAVLFMLIIGAFNWITSGGDKEKVKSARERIVSALIGLALLALAFLVTNVVGKLLNINILDLQKLPTLQSCPTGVFDPKTGGCVAPGTPVAPAP